MRFPSYIYSVAALDGARALVLRSNPQNTRPDLLELWDLAAGERLFQVSTQARRATAMAAAGGVALTGDAEGVLRIWSLPGGECRKSVDVRGAAPKGAPIGALALLDSARRALVASAGGVALWDLDSARRLREYAADGHPVNAFAVLSDQTRFLTASSDRSVRLWDTRRSECLRTFLEPGLPAFAPRLDARDPQCATGVCALHDGRHAVSSHGDGMLRRWDLETGALLRKARASRGDLAWLVSVAASPGEDCVAASGWDRNLWIWAPPGEPRALAGHAGEVMQASFLDGGRLAVSGSMDQTLRVWDLGRAECVRVIGKPIESSQWPPNESRW